MLQIPNGVGGGLGILQLILYAIYYNNKEKLKNTTKNESSMEMGFTGRDHKSRSDGQKPLSENGEMKPGGSQRSGIDGQKPLRS